MRFRQRQAVRTRPWLWGTLYGVSIGLGIGIGFVVAGRSWHAVLLGLAAGIAVGGCLGLLLRVQGAGREARPPD
jgi:zinc transporter ZupT